MNRGVLHSLDPKFFLEGAGDEPQRGSATEFFRIFVSSWATTAIAAGFVIETASAATKFVSIPVRWPAAWAFRTLIHQGKEPSRFLPERLKRSCGTIPIASCWLPSRNFDASQRKM